VCDRDICPSSRRHRGRKENVSDIQSERGGWYLSTSLVIRVCFRVVVVVVVVGRGGGGGDGDGVSVEWSSSLGTRGGGWSRGCKLWGWKGPTFSDQEWMSFGVWDMMRASAALSVEYSMTSFHDGHGQLLSGSSSSVGGSEDCCCF